MDAVDASFLADPHLARQAVWEPGRGVGDATQERIWGRGLELGRVRAWVNDECGALAGSAAHEFSTRSRGTGGVDNGHRLDDPQWIVRWAPRGGGVTIRRLKPVAVVTEEPRGTGIDHEPLRVLAVVLHFVVEPWEALEQEIAQVVPPGPELDWRA
jgi:hypothetical protein